MCPEFKINKMEPAPVFNIGDKVRLKTGGPDMVIDSRACAPLTGKPYPDRFVCVWFEDGKLMKEIFNVKSLNPID